MKSAWFVPVLSVAALGLAPSAGAATVFTNTFDSYAEGSKSNGNLATFESATTNFKIRAEADVNNYLNAGTANKVLNFQDLSTASGNIKPAAGITGATSVETLGFDYYEPSLSGTGTPLYVRVGSNATDISSTNSYVFQLQFNNGNIGSTLGVYTLDAAHHIDVVANNTSSQVTYNGVTLNALAADVYVDRVLAVHNFGRFASTTTAAGTALNAFVFQTFGGDANQQAYLDNIAVQDAAVPEPAMLGLLAIGATGVLGRRRA